MESRRPGPRAGPGQACLGHYGRNPQHSVPRNWIRRLYQKTFYFHFQNLPRAFGRHNTFLCYQVEGSWGSSPDKGIFMNQMRPRAPENHAELSFLSWFENCLPLPAQQPYQVTWYLSWSPCSRCAERVAAFLDTHRNVSLTIYTARLYYHWHPEYRAGLFRLVSAGAQVAAMSFSEFEKCWEEFVYNDGTPFRPWRMLYRNYCVQADNLQDILGGAVGLLKEETFCFQFNNQRQVPKTHRRRRPYLCYQLATSTGSLLHRGSLCNQEDRHVEVCLIDKIQSMGLDPAQSYQLTCYLSWSPCPLCARELLDFASSHRNLGLQIFASRLYFHWRRNFQQGLYLLCKAHVPVTVMGLPEFQHCWKTFVDQAKPFPAWPKLPERSASIKNRLQRILKGSCCPQPPRPSLSCSLPPPLFWRPLPFPSLPPGPPTSLSASLSGLPGPWSRPSLVPACTVTSPSLSHCGFTPMGAS